MLFIDSLVMLRSAVGVRGLAIVGVLALDGTPAILRGSNIKGGWMVATKPSSGFGFRNLESQREVPAQLIGVGVAGSVGGVVSHAGQGEIGMNSECQGFKSWWI